MAERRMTQPLVPEPAYDVCPQGDSSPSYASAPHIGAVPSPALPFTHGAQVRGALRQERPGDPADRVRADRARTSRREELGVPIAESAPLYRVGKLSHAGESWAYVVWTGRDFGSSYCRRSASLPWRGVSTRDSGARTHLPPGRWNRPDPRRQGRRQGRLGAGRLPCHPCLRCRSRRPVRRQ